MVTLYYSFNSKAHGAGYRPILLTSCMLKLLKCMILNRLGFLSHPPHLSLCYSQSTSLDLGNLSPPKITLLSCPLTFTRPIFFSVHSGCIKSTFDNVLPHILIHLINLSFSPLLIKFINNLIASRRVQFVVQGSFSFI